LFESEFGTPIRVPKRGSVWNPFSKHGFAHQLKSLLMLLGEKWDKISSRHKKNLA